jgi:NAD(P)H-dependent flavin oxidoreductase YrpB (nitropropane dioxygenase family)
MCTPQVGAPKHVRKALAVGADMICAQGTEGGGKYPFKRAHPVTRSDGRCATGHTGDVPSSVLIPACVAEAKGHMSPLTGKQVQVIAAGGIYNGMGLASALAVGASGVWVGTRFIVCPGHLLSECIRCSRA